ncbi:MAG: SusC/RagA family TonB-linked outer membrane protein [Mucilaginibacter sp.]|nr:MAG: SusC/RagA family TonB-linked outer membrane protein [Mucilaginibacter sp.]HEK19365.1 SusC/RagA family TonB-linked outer membrane protein [Bacteroidota bacterium]
MKYFLLTICILFCRLYAEGQSVIKGRVLSATDSLPVTGATVRLKGTNIGTVSNEKGMFSIPFKGAQSILETSFIGYKTEISSINTANDRFLTIVLKSSYNQLNEVNVSTGYQNLPKERATGSFNLIDNKTFNQQVGTDVLSRLGAVANGLTIDRGTGPTGQITIRGLSTINGPKDPLIVLDNFPYDGDINNINPNDVDNITILKDAAAASIWGARAGNGVIVITTKKGKFNQPLTIDFNANATIGAKPDLSYLKVMSSSDFIDVEQMLYSQGFYNDWINSSNHRVLSDVVELLIKRDNGALSATNAASQINTLRQHDVRTDFNKYIYQQSVNQQYALSLRGGSNTMSWNASTGYDHNMDNLAAGYNRINVRFQNTYRVTKNLDLSSGIYYTQSDQKSGKSGYGSITQYASSILPYAQLADQNGNALAIPRNNSISYLSTAGNGSLLDWKYYPLEDYKHSKSTQSLQDMVLNTGLNYRFLSGFNLDLKYQYERQNVDGQTLNDADSYYARNLVNSFTQIATDGTVSNIIPKGGILDLSESKIQSHDLRAQLNYNKIWGKHELSAIAGNEWRLATMTGNSSRLYGYNNNILTFGNVDYSNAYPDFISGDLNYIPNNQSIDHKQTNYISSFANAAYTYDQKYVLSLSGRRDASNLFGLNTNNQWNPFWSTGLSWLLSNESFYKSKLVPVLKIRATYGLSGNIDPGMSAVTTIQYASNSPYTNSPYSRFINYYNPDLKWETSKMLNVGIDFQTAENRLSGSVEYYHKQGDNLFGTALIDYTAGIGNSIVKNAANMKGNGLDIELKSLNLKGQLQWQTVLNFSYYKDQVTNYYLSSTQGSSFVGANVPISGVTGKPVYSIFAYKWSGLDPQTGDPRGYLNGQISKDYTSLTGSATQVSDLQYFGSATPTMFGNMSNTFTYKSISLNFSMVYKLGYYFRRTSVNYTNLFNNWLGNSDYTLRWQKSGDEKTTNAPSLVYPAVTARDAFYAGSAPLVEKGDHIRLQYINLSYQLSKDIVRYLPVKSLQLYVNASNLGIIWRANKQGIDPDYNYTPNSLVNPRTYSFGLRANMN